MRILLLYCLTFIVSISFTNAQKAPFVYTSQLSSLSIEFPGKPESRVQELGVGGMEEVLFKTDHVQYGLKISVAGDYESIEKELAKFGSRHGMAKKMAANFHGKNQGTMEGLVREDWELGAYKGQQITFKSRRYGHHYSVIIIDSTVIEVFVKADTKPKEESYYNQQKVDAFAKSLKIGD